jgi:hypothetical protein
MNRFFLFMLCFALAHPAEAQDAAHVTMQPICFQVQNASPYTVFGAMVSNVYTAPDGTTARHHTNFRLESRHFAQFCSTGPFYPGDKLDLQLRSLFPVFECRTGVSGPIVIHGQQQDDGSYKTWADCL